MDAVSISGYRPDQITCIRVCPSQTDWLSIVHLGVESSLLEREKTMDVSQRTVITSVWCYS